MTTSNTSVFNKTTFASIDEAVTYMNKVSLAARMLLKNELPTAKSAKSLDLIEAMIDAEMIIIVQVAQNAPSEPTISPALPVQEADSTVISPVLLTESAPVIVQLAQSDAKKDAQNLLKFVNNFKVMLAGNCAIANKQLEVLESLGLTLTTPAQKEKAIARFMTISIDHNAPYEVDAQFSALLQAEKIEMGKVILSQAMIDAANAATTTPEQRLHNEFDAYVAKMKRTCAYNSHKLYFDELLTGWTAFANAHGIDATFTVENGEFTPVLKAAKVRSATVRSVKTTNSDSGASVVSTRNMRVVSGLDLTRQANGWIMTFTSDDATWEIVAEDKDGNIKRWSDKLIGYEISPSKATVLGYKFVTSPESSVSAPQFWATTFYEANLT